MAINGTKQFEISCGVQSIDGLQSEPDYILLYSPIFKAYYAVDGYVLTKKST
eukprot:UN34090